MVTIDLPLVDSVVVAFIVVDFVSTMCCLGTSVDLDVDAVDASVDVSSLDRVVVKNSANVGEDGSFMETFAYVVLSTENKKKPLNIATVEITNYQI